MARRCGYHVSRWPTGLARADRRDLPLVIGLAALLVIDGALSGEGDVTALAVGAVALATVPLLWRRSAPRVVLLALVAGARGRIACRVRPRGRGDSDLAAPHPATRVVEPVSCAARR